MPHAAEIDKAMGAHALWRGRLILAIETGKSDLAIDKVRLDNQCDFGKWLYALPPSEQESEFAKKVKVLHSQFHIHAAKVLALALAGRRKEATEAIAIDSEFIKTSTQLTKTLMEWKKASG